MQIAVFEAVRGRYAALWEVFFILGGLDFWNDFPNDYALGPRNLRF